MRIVRFERQVLLHHGRVVADVLTDFWKALWHGIFSVFGCILCARGDSEFFIDFRMLG